MRLCTRLTAGPIYADDLSLIEGSLRFSIPPCLRSLLFLLRSPYCTRCPTRLLPCSIGSRDRSLQPNPTRWPRSIPFQTASPGLRVCTLVIFLLSRWPKPFSPSFPTFASSARSLPSLVLSVGFFPTSLSRAMHSPRRSGFALRIVVGRFL